MTPKLQQKLLQITRDLKDTATCKNSHFSFLVDKNKVISVGMNSMKTHPTAFFHHYLDSRTHSELSCLLKLNNRPGKEKDLRKFTLVNTRINRLGVIQLSRPCQKCLAWLSTMGFKAIYYTDKNGDFQKL